MSHVFQSVGSASSLSEKIEAEIESAIRQKKLAPGTKLPSERELCDQFGVSRTVMREALRGLSARGLVTIEKGRGMFVSEVSVETVTIPMELYLYMNHGIEYGLHVVHARQIIEPGIAALAAVHHTAEDAEAMQADIERLVDTKGFEELSKQDMSFHHHIAEAAGNPVLPLLIKPIQHIMPEIKTSVYGAVEDAKESAVEWHGKILEAILDRDPKKARRMMEEHLVIAEEHIQRLLDLAMDELATETKSS